MAEESKKVVPGLAAGNGSDSSEERNAKSLFDAEIGEPLTTTTTPGVDLDAFKEGNSGAAEATILGGIPVPSTYPPESQPYPTFPLGPSPPSPLPEYPPPPQSTDWRIPEYPPVTFDDNVNVDELSDGGAGDSYRPYRRRYDDDYRSLDEKIRKAPKQVSQIVQYTKLMEERVQALEEEVRLLKLAKKSSPDDIPPLDPYGLPYSPPSLEKEGEVSKIPILIPDIRRVFWAEYDGDRATHTLDVTYGDQDDIPPKETHTLWNNQTHEKENKLPVPVPGRDGRPSRIRIQSRLVRTELRKLTEYDIMLESREVLAPFKPFVLFEDKIRAHQKVLEERLAGLIEKERILLAEVALEEEKEKEEEKRRNEENEKEKENEKSASAPASIAGPIVEDVARKASDGKDISLLASVSPSKSVSVEPAAALPGAGDDIKAKDGADGKNIENIDTEGRRTLEKSYSQLRPSEPIDPYEAKKIKPVIKKFTPPEYAIEVPRLDSLVMDEKIFSPQDIGCLMVGCKASKDLSISYLSTYGGYDEAYNRLLDFAPLEEKDELYRHVSLLDAYTLVEEWKAVVKLLDTDLAEIFKLREQVKNQTLESISFEDLSHLFEPGQMVLESDGKDFQLLQVFSSTGGRRILDDGTLLDPDVPAADATAAEQQQQAVVTVFGNIGNLLHANAKYSPFVVDSYYIDFDGYTFGPVQKTNSISRYDGIVPLAQLPLVPAWLNKRNKDVEKAKDDREGKEIEGEQPEVQPKSKKEAKDPWNTLLERGKKFAKLCDTSKVVHRQYCGLSFDEPAEEVDSKVIIDFKMASLAAMDQRPPGQGWVQKLGLTGASRSDEREIKGPSAARACKIPNCTICPPGKSLSPLLNDQKTSQQQSRDFILSCPILLEQSLKTRQKLEDDDYRLMPCRIFGFILRSRKWARLNVECIRKINHEENNFKKLVLPEGYADLVQALVETHTKSNKGVKEVKKEGPHEVDLVRGKGKGLIILLHGAPGVGKTSTAECVADHTRRPLFPITCGDIGDTAESVEKNLERCFQLAHKWGCVLLLDEADVFLAERSKTDLQRNALVSVFLRVLEYYAGILFLTTNRVGTFDEAFKSRIHMSLGYPKLSKKQTKQIWKMNIKRTQEAKDLGLEIDEEDIMEYADDHWDYAKDEDNHVSFWNGRQIRNAFQTAIALAKWDFEQKKVPKAVLNQTHFEKVAKASRQFDEYLQEVYGGATESRRAFDEDKRADHFEPGLKALKRQSTINTANFAKPAKKSSSSKKKSSSREIESVQATPVKSTPIKKKKKKEEPPPKEDTEPEEESNSEEQEGSSEEASGSE